MRNQATRFDVLRAQDQRRKKRRELMVLAPLALMSMLVFGYAVAGFMTPLQ